MKKNLTSKLTNLNPSDFREKIHLNNQYVPVIRFQMKFSNVKSARKAANDFNANRYRSSVNQKNMG